MPKTKRTSNNILTKLLLHVFVVLLFSLSVLPVFAVEDEQTAVAVGVVEIQLHTADTLQPLEGSVFGLYDGDIQLCKLVTDRDGMASGSAIINRTKKCWTW